MIFLLFCLNSFSQKADRTIGRQLNTTINQTLDIVEKSNEYLVVFNSPCLIEQLNDNANLKSKRIIQPLQNEHNRFIEDLSRLRKSGSTSLKSVSISKFKHELFRTINAVLIESCEEEIKEIRKLNYVKTVLRNSKVESVGEIPINSTISALNNNYSANFSNNGEGVKIGIIDTGIDYNNPALGGGFGSGFKVAGGYDFVNKDNDPMDDSGHGTGVAGVIAASGELSGIAPDATLYAYKTQDTWGSGWSNNAITALEYCVDPNQDFDLSDHMDIVNMSIACYELNNNEREAIAEIFKMATSLKMIICVAAGNEGPGYIDFNQFAIFDNVISVGSCNLKNEISTFSCRGFGINNYSIKPDLVSLGENVEILNLLNSTDTNGGGTSIACPGVSGVAVLLKQKHPSWTYEEIKSSLVNSATDLGVNVMLQGAGKVNKNDALNLNTLVYPQTINWGISSENKEEEEKIFAVSLYNKSSQQQVYQINLDQEFPSGIKVSADPSNFSIQSNDSISITFRLSIDRSKLAFPQEVPFNYFGRFNISGGSDSISIPWTLIRGCLIHTDTDLKISKTVQDPFIKILKDDKLVNSTKQYNPDKDIIVPPGYYDIIFSAKEGDYNFTSDDTIRTYFYVAEDVLLERNDTLHFNKSMMKNPVYLRSVDEKGQILNDKNLTYNQQLRNGNNDANRKYFALNRLGGTQNPIMPDFFTDEFYINSITLNKYKFNIGESNFKFKDRLDFFIQNYADIDNITDTLYLEKSSNSLNQYNFLVFPDIQFNCYFGQQPTYTDFGWGGPIFKENKIQNVTFSKLWIDKPMDKSACVTAVPEMQSFDSLFQCYQTDCGFRPIYSYGDSIQFGSYNSFGTEEFLTIHKGDTIYLNDGPVYYSLNISKRFNYYFFNCYSYMKGMYGELRQHSMYKTLLSIYNSADHLVYEDNVRKYYDSPYTETLGGGVFQLTSNDYYVQGVRGKVCIKYKLPENELDFKFTSIQKLQFIDSENKIKSKFKIGSSAKLKIELNNANTTNSIKLYCKLSNETEWENRSFSIRVESWINKNLIETDLSDLLTESNGLDLKIEALDSLGNTMTFTLEPAIAIGDYHQNHNFKLNEIQDTVVFANTTLKKKLDFDAFFPEFNIFDWEASIIKGTGTVEIKNDSIYISSTTNNNEDLTIQIKGKDGGETDSALFHLFYNELLDTSFFAVQGCENGECLGQIKMKYDQENVHYSLLKSKSSDIFKLDSLTGDLFVLYGDSISHSYSDPYLIEVMASDGVLTDTSIVKVFVVTKPLAHDYSFEIVEGTPSGSVVGVIYPPGEDGVKPTYRILTGDENEIFRLNPLSGELIINKADEIVYGKEFKMTWIAIDGEMSRLANVIITVLKLTTVEEYFTNILVYPNPTRDKISIENISNINSIQVVDLMGNVLIDKSLIRTSQIMILDLSQLKTGIYFLKINNNKGLNALKIVKI
jgi:hypothetical protein